LSDHLKEPIIVPIHKKGDKTDCNNYHGISLLSTSYKMLLSILSRLNPYIDEIIGDRCVNFMLFVLQLLLVLSIFLISCSVKGSVLVLKLNVFRACNCFFSSTERTVAQM
jgi:hypothetical protein